jgi:ABC-type polysaccharide/polyol phosphate export permease
MNIRLQTSIFWQLLRADIRIFHRDNLLDDCINGVIWMSANFAIATYIFPKLGMSSGYGALLAIATVSSMSIFLLYDFVCNFISDLEDNKTFTYYFTLPIPNWLVWLKSLTYYAYRAFINGLIVLPLAKWVMGNRLNFSNCDWIKLFVMYVLIMIFNGALTLVVQSIPEDMSRIGVVWCRVVFPLWISSGWQYSLATLQEVSPLLAWMTMINPLIYTTEGLRAAVLGQKGFLSWWLCVGMLVLFSIVCAWYGIVRLKQRLDYV